MAKRTSQRSMPAVFVDRLSVQVGTPLADIKATLLAETLRATNGNQTAAARLLGLNVSTIYRWLKRGTKGEAAAGVAMRGTQR